MWKKSGEEKEGWGARMAATCNNICKAASALSSITSSPSLSTCSSHLLLLPSLSLLPQSSVLSTKSSTSSFGLTHVVKNSGRVTFRAMSSSSQSGLDDTVKKTIADYPVVVYSKSWCSWVLDSFFFVCFSWLFLSY